MTTTRVPALAVWASWAVLAASFGLSAATWIALGDLAGFGSPVALPFGMRARLSWLMPVAVDGYVVVALVLWMSPVPARVASFARANTYTAAGCGVIAQSAFHALTTWTTTGVLWRAILAAAVGAMPPAVSAVCVHMRALLHREAHTATIGEAAPAAVAVELVDEGQAVTVTPSRPATALVPVTAETFARANNTTPTVHSGGAR